MQKVSSRTKLNIELLTFKAEILVIEKKVFLEIGLHRDSTQKPVGLSFT